MRKGLCVDEGGLFVCAPRIERSNGSALQDSVAHHSDTELPY